MNKKIEEYRKTLDQIDDQIASLLLKRLSLVKKIGEEKKKNSIQVLDKNREERIKNRLTAGIENRDSVLYLLNIYEGIMKESKKVQSKREGPGSNSF